MPHCVAVGCKFQSKGNKNSYVSLHCFPTDKKRRAEWENACGRSQLPKDPRLCSGHFLSDAFEAFDRPRLLNELMGAGTYKRRLKPDAVPTIFSHKAPKRPREVSKKRAQKQPAPAAAAAGEPSCAAPTVAEAENHPVQKPSVSVQCSPRVTDAAVQWPEDAHQLVLDHAYAVLPSDVRKVIIGEEEQKEWSSTLDQEDPPKPPHIKEEQEEVWTSQEEQEEAENTKFTFTTDAVKSEDEEEEKPLSSQLHQTHAEENRRIEQMKTEADEEDDGGPEPAGSSDPESHLQPDTDYKASDSSDTEVSDGDWESQCSLDSHKNNGVSAVMDFNCNTVERSFSCSECGQRFGRKPHLNAHMRIHTGEKPFSCSFCGKRFSQKGNSISHMRLHTGEKPFSCSVCNKSFRYSGDVSRHMRIHTGKKKIKRTMSDVIDSNTDAGSEPNRNADPGRYLAPVTDDNAPEPQTEPSGDGWKETRDQSDSSALTNDDVSPSDARCNNGDKESFSCSECGRTFCRKDHLMSHMRTHTGEKPFSCSVCQKRFSCSGNILAHMRIHTGEKPFECSFCGKSFSQKGTLQLHVRIHTGEKPFSCPFCEKRFAHKRRMTLHMSVHTEEKRFSCSVCDKRFTWYTQLKTHKCVGESSQIRQNQTDKKVSAKESFSCTECGKKFSLKGNLKTHMRIHTGEKPFSCRICGKSFKQNVHLTEHMTIHTGRKLYQCNVCGKGFNKKLLIKKHACL